MFAGVPLTGGGNRTVNLIEPNTMFLDYQTQVDARVSRTFRFGNNKRAQAYVDIFSLLNASSVASENQDVYDRSSLELAPAAGGDESPALPVRWPLRLLEVVSQMQGRPRKPQTNLTRLSMFFVVSHSRRCRIHETACRLRRHWIAMKA